MQRRCMWNLVARDLEEQVVAPSCLFPTCHFTRKIGRIDRLHVGRAPSRIEVGYCLTVQQRGVVQSNHAMQNNPRHLEERSHRDDNIPTPLQNITQTLNQSALHSQEQNQGAQRASQLSLFCTHINQEDHGMACTKCGCSCSEDECLPHKCYETALALTGIRLLCSCALVLSHSN